MMRRSNKQFAYERYDPYLNDKRGIKSTERLEIGK